MDLEQTDTCQISKLKCPAGGLVDYEPKLCFFPSEYAKFFLYMPDIPPGEQANLRQTLLSLAGHFCLTIKEPFAGHFENSPTLFIKDT